MGKKVLALLTMATLLATLFAGCVGFAAEGEQVTVRVRSGWTEAGLPNWKDAIAKFEEEHPDIKIEIEYTPAGEDSMTKLRAEYVAGNPPDVVQAWKTFFNEFVDAGLVTNLNDAYEQYGWGEGVLMDGARSWCAPIADAANENADVYGVADYVNTSVIYYNKGVFDELGLTEPTNLEELIEVSNALRAGGKKAMVVVGNGNNFVDLLAKIQVQFTGLQYLLDVNAGTAKLTDEPMLKAMEVVQTLIDNEVIDKSSLTYREEDCVRELASGNAGMFAMHTSYDRQMLDAQALDPTFQYGIMKGILFTDDPVTEYSCTYGGCWMIPESSQVKEAATEFLFYIFGPEVSVGSAESGRITNMLAANANIGSEAIQTVVEYQLPNLGYDTFYLVDMVPGSVLTALVTGMQEMLEGNGNAMSALQGAQEAMDRVLADAE